MKLSLAWQRLVIGGLAEMAGTFVLSAEIVSTAAVSAGAVGTFVVLAENKTDMGCIAPEAYGGHG